MRSLWALMLLFAAAMSVESAEAPPKSDEKSDAKAAATPETPASQATPAKDEEEKSAETKSEPSKSAADQKPSPQRFIPSEQVRADFDVSFPIDI